VSSLEIFDQLNSVTISEGNIHDSNMRIRPGDGLECFRSVLGFGADHKISLLIDELGKSLPDYWMIIHKEDSRLLVH